MSSKPISGKHSPGAQGKSNQFKGRKAASVDVRTVLLFILPTPLLLGALSAVFAGAAIHTVLMLLAYGCLMLGAWLVREGQRAHAAYEARDIARPPAFPRKLCAAALAGIGVFLASWLGNPAETFLEIGGSLVSSTIFGVLAAGAHVVAFGIDPMRSKGTGTGGIAEAELDRVAVALDKAEAKLKTIEDLAAQMRDKAINRRVRDLNQTVREMIEIVERDPRDLSRARRYLGVYLKGAKDATQKYADQHAHLDHDSPVRHDFLTLLSDLEANFERGKQTLLLDDRTDLEIEIEVLRERLDQESR